MVRQFNILPEHFEELLDYCFELGTLLQTVEPYAIAILVWDKDDIAVGKYKYNTALSIVEESIKTNQFRGYESFADNILGLIPMKLPNWNNTELLPSI